MTKVKICGITRAEDALFVAQSGADFLGFVFAPSRRKVSVPEAAGMASAVRNSTNSCSLVGVFVNTPPAEINEIARMCKLDWVQLSGDETWADCLDCLYPVIKVIHVSPNTTAREVTTEINIGQKALAHRKWLCLIDNRTRGSYGGTGETFDWRVAREAVRLHPVVIAGGLSPGNVKVLINEIQPWGVDVSSGVETGGQKNHMKITAFIEAVKQ